MGSAARAGYWRETWFGLAVMVAVWALQAGTGWLNPLEWSVYDASIRTAGRVASPDIAIVVVDDASLAELGPLPWPAERHAQLIDGLAQAGARTLVFTSPMNGRLSAAAQPQLHRMRDLVAADAALAAHPTLGAAVKQLQASFDADERLASSLAAQGGAVLAADALHNVPRTQSQVLAPVAASRSLLQGPVEGLGAAGAVQWPDDALAGAALAVGHRAQMPDSDGRLRRHTALLAVGDQAWPSLALWAAAGGRRLARSSDGGVRLGKESLNLGPHAVLYPMFYATSDGRKPFFAASYAAVLRGEVPQARFKDKTVFIGPTAPTLDAGIDTPLGITMPAVEAAAHVTSTLRMRHVVSAPSWSAWVSALASLAAMGVVVAWLPRLRIGAAAAIAALLALALMSIEWALLTQSLLWLPLAVPAALLMLGHLFATLQRGLYALNELPRVRAVNAGPISNHSAPQSDLANALLSQGQFDLAWEHYRKLPLGSHPGNALIASLYRLGRAFEERGDASLAHAVYRHMASYDTAYKDVQARLQRMTSPPPAPGSAAVAVATLGRYQVQRELGRGAMGAVLLGIDPVIGRQVALKTLDLGQEFEGEALAEARRRFIREAETAGRLQHPNIVTIFDVGEENGLAYIAMEFIKGHDLQRHTHAAQLLPVAVVLRIAVRVAEALAYAHRQGVVHRDIKPANVMVDLEGEGVKVTDFGIARITDSGRTRTGMVLGTPSFMSPEQMAGRRVDGRSDIYSLGAMLYQLLSGQLPHRADSMAALMHQIAHQAVPDIRTLRPELPEALANVIALALEKRPEMRYADGRQLAEDLQLVEGQLNLAEPATAMSPSTVEASPNAGLFAATVRILPADPRHNPNE